MSFSLYLLQVQKALVTGSSSGIGESIARYLAASGTAVVVNYHSEAEEAHKIVDDIKSAGGEAIAIQANVSKEFACEADALTAAAEFEKTLNYHLLDGLTDSTLPNQKGKPTTKPRLRWILQCFQSVHLIFVDGIKTSKTF